MAVDFVLEGVEVDRSVLEERVYTALRLKILNRELVPGTVLTIRQVASALGVSSTPVRAALRRLQGDQLVRDRGRLGAEVEGLSAKDISELFGVRLALETFAACIVVARPMPTLLTRLQNIVTQFPTTFDGDRYTDYERFSLLDVEFHTRIIGGAANDRLIQVYQALGVHMHLARIYQREVEQRAQANHREHRAIIDALRAADPDGMTRAVTTHIVNVRDHILHMMGPGHIVI